MDYRKKLLHKSIGKLCTVILRETDVKAFHCPEICTKCVTSTKVASEIGNS